MTVTAPEMSRDFLGPRSSAPGSAIHAAIISTTPIGTLTMSTQRQSRRLVRIPPARTPTAAPLAAVADQAPRARRRSPGSVKVVTRMLRVAGARMAPPMPWAARAAISQLPVWARPPIRLQTVKTPRPIMNTRRRPKRSAARPPSIRKPAKVSV